MKQLLVGYKLEQPLWKFLATPHPQLAIHRVNTLLVLCTWSGHAHSIEPRITSGSDMYVPP